MFRTHFSIDLRNPTVTHTVDNASFLSTESV